jgi:hypothetical protein
LESARPGITDEVNSIVLNLRFKNPDALHSFLDNARKNSDKTGWQYELDVLKEKLNTNSDIGFSVKDLNNKEIDILDYTASTIIELKSYSSSSWITIAKNFGNDVGCQIGTIENSLKSQFSSLIGQVRIEIGGNDIWRNATKMELIENLKSAILNPDWGASLKLNMDNMTHLIIENATGKHVIERASWQ